MWRTDTGSTFAAIDARPLGSCRAQSQRVRAQKREPVRRTRSGAGVAGAEAETGVCATDAGAGVAGAGVAGAGAGAGACATDAGVAGGSYATFGVVV